MNKPPSRRKDNNLEGSTSNHLMSAKSANQDISVNNALFVEAIDIEEMSEEEVRDRVHLERKVEHAFYEAGKALKELRDRKLFRNTHETFEEYCKDRFGFERRHPYRLIDAAGVIDNLKQMCPNRYIHIHKEIKQQQQRFCNKAF